MLKLNDVIFLLGAGASVEAGMPMVVGLTEKLRSILHEIPDVNGKLRPEFKCLFERIAEVDKDIENNYERFFEWLNLLNKAQKSPFSKILDPRVPILKASGELSFVIGDGIKRILESCPTEPGYLSRFGDFVPKKGRLKIFSLNYDCCLEDACRSADIYITTGFDPISKKWTPGLFEESNEGINLYKLHSSLRWYPVAGLCGSRCYSELMELNKEDRKLFSKRFKIGDSPELILGPGSKIQSDAPFIALLYEFHCALHLAKVCVTIGYGYRDKHINNMLEDAFFKKNSKLYILDINPDDPNGTYTAESRYKHLKHKTKGILEDGLIEKYIEEFL